MVDQRYVEERSGRIETFSRDLAAVHRHERSGKLLDIGCHLGMFLEVATTTGAICGAGVAAMLAPNALGIIFGLVLLISAAPLVLKLGEELPRHVTHDRLARAFSLDGAYPDHRLGREVHYQVTRTPWGLAMMYLAGLISGLLGIGSGPFKVIAMDGNPVPTQASVDVLMLGVAERVDAVVEMNQPGVWILGSTDDEERMNGMGVVIEYAGQTGEPAWVKPAKAPWDYTPFGTQNKLPEPDGTFELTFKKIPGNFQRAAILDLQILPRHHHWQQRRAGGQDHQIFHANTPTLAHVLG